MKLSVHAALLAATLASAGAQANVIPGNWTLLTSTGNYGVLRPDSGWEGTANLASQSSVVDGSFLGAGQDWNNGTWWWDQDPAVNSDWGVPMGIEIHLNGMYELNRFVVQADDNDSYRIEYWDGAAWQTAWDIAAIGGYGMQTRDSGLLGSVTTDRLRFFATGGDNYYSVSEIQAFAVPEPQTYALMALGLAGVGAWVRRQQRR